MSALRTVNSPVIWIISRIVLRHWWKFLLGMILLPCTFLHKTMLFMNWLIWIEANIKCFHQFLPSFQSPFAALILRYKILFPADYVFRRKSCIARHFSFSAHATPHHTSHSVIYGYMGSSPL